MNEVTKNGGGRDCVTVVKLSLCHVFFGQSVIFVTKELIAAPIVAFRTVRNNSVRHSGGRISVSRTLIFPKYNRVGKGAARHPFA